MISHLDSVVGGITDPFISSRYVGFVAVAAVTVYELAIKDIFYEFAKMKHNVFGNFVFKHFERINGRIKLDNLRRTYIERFGIQYLVRFDTKLDVLDNISIHRGDGSIKETYNNIITWRHQFAHAGKIPSTATYEEVTKAYSNGKGVIHCLAKTMQD